MIRNSVGQDGFNEANDVLYVQLLLCDWLVRTGRAEIAIDGACGPMTISAIITFQNEETSVTDGLIEVDKNTIKRLQDKHVENMVSGVFTSPVDVEGFPFGRVENSVVKTMVDSYLSTLRAGLDLG